MWRLEKSEVEKKAMAKKKDEGEGVQITLRTKQKDEEGKAEMRGQLCNQG
jgi:hypothetical protein